MSAVIGNSLAASNPQSARAAAIRAKGWKDWRVVRVIGKALATLRRVVAVVTRFETRTPEAVRAAEKERQKEIRRELRGLPPTLETPPTAKRPE